MVKSEEIRDRQKLANLITQWNLDHYDLFELSAPNEVILEIHLFFRHNLLRYKVLHRRCPRL